MRLVPPCIALSFFGALSAFAAPARAEGSYELPSYGIGFGATEFEYVLPFNLHVDDGVHLAPCLVTNDKKLAGYRAGQLDQSIQKKYSYDWTEAALDASLRVSARLFGVNVASAKVSTRFLSANVNTKLSFASVTQYDLRAGTLLLTEPKLASDVQPLADDASRLYRRARGTDPNGPAYKAFKRKALEFYLRCGDRFISQVVLGSRFLGAIRVHFKDTRLLLDFRVNAEAKILGKKKSWGDHKYYDTHLADSIIEVDIHQEGGDQTKVGALRRYLGGDAPTSSGSRRSRCFIEPFDFAEPDDFKNKVDRQLERCFVAWDAVNDYLRSAYYEQISRPDLGGLAALEDFKTGYAAAGLIDFPIELEAGVRRNLETLNRILGRLARLELLSMTASQSRERTAFSQLSAAWQASSQRYAALATTLHTLTQGLENAARRCIGQIKNGQAGDCALPSTAELADFKDLLFTTELD